MKPDTLVRWQQNNITMIGRIISNGGDTAQVEAHGNTYEVSAERLRIVPTCRTCGQPVKNKRRVFCSRECRAVIQRKNRCVHCGKKMAHSGRTCRACSVALREKENDQRIFDAIIDYKRRFDGATIDNETLERVTFSCGDTIKFALARLEKAGRIQRIGNNATRKIIVIGGKWTYEEPKDG